MMLFGVIPFYFRINSLQLIVEVVKLSSHPLHLIMDPLKTLVDCVKFMFPKEDDLLIVFLL